VGPVCITPEQIYDLQRPNIELVGKKPYEQLPSLMAEASVGMIPFVINDLIKATNPIKLFEYLAAGLPVVSTPMPEVVAMQTPALIACEETAEGFAAAIERLGSRDVSEQAMEIASGHSWEGRFALGLQGLVPSEKIRRSHGVY
jgi:glycosyltransferase involved in cell wall biosynthesis